MHLSGPSEQGQWWFEHLDRRLGVQGCEEPSLASLQHPTDRLPAICMLLFESSTLEPGNGTSPLARNVLKRASPDQTVCGARSGACYCIAAHPAPDSAAQSCASYPLGGYVFPTRTGTGPSYGTIQISLRVFRLFACAMPVAPRKLLISPDCCEPSYVCSELTI